MHLGNEIYLGKFIFVVSLITIPQSYFRNNHKYGKKYSDIYAFFGCLFYNNFLLTVYIPYLSHFLPASGLLFFSFLCILKFDLLYLKGKIISVIIYLQFHNENQFENIADCVKISSIVF